MIKINLKRVAGDFGFEAIDASGHVLKMDTSSESGGVDFGIRPMQVLLMGMGGCSGIDIVMILQKQRQTIVDFSMHDNLLKSAFEGTDSLFDLINGLLFNKDNSILTTYS